MGAEGSGTSPAEAFERLNASIPFDVRLAPYDLRGSVAHAKMLGARGIVSERESAELVRGLEAVLAEVESGVFSWDRSRRGCSYRGRAAVARACGRRGAQTAHGPQPQRPGRARPSPVRQGRRRRIGEGVLAAMRALVEVAETNRDLILPGYTHLQRAQPILLAHHLLAHFEALKRDLRRLEAARDAANLLPARRCGAGRDAASYRPFLTRRSSAWSRSRNSLDAVSERDFALDLLMPAPCSGCTLAAWEKTGCCGRALSSVSPRWMTPTLRAPHHAAEKEP